MSASKFFRNFLTLSQMGTKEENSCYPPRESVNCNDGPDVQKTRGSALPTPESKCKSEIHDPLSIPHSSYERHRKVSKVASTTDLSENLNDKHGMRDLRQSLRVVDTLTDNKIDRHCYGTEEIGRVQVNTTIRGEEVKNESPTVYEQSRSGGTEIHATDAVGPVESTNLQAMFHGFLKACITEEKLVDISASAGVFDKLLQNYLNTLNATAKTNELKDSHKAASVNGEQQEHLDVSLIDVSIPETIEERHDYCLQESVMQKKRQNVKPEQRLSTDHQNSDSADRGKEFSLIMGHGCDIEQKSTICGSNGLKPFALNDEGIMQGTSDETGGDLNITTTQSRGGGNNKDVKLSCNSIPLSTAKDQESLKFLLERGRYFIDIANDTIAAENLSQPIEIDDSQHSRTSENIDTSIIDSDRGEVEPSTGSPSEKTKDASSMIGYEAANASDDECSSIASSSNTEIYEESDCQDVEIHEEDTQDSVIKRDVDNFAASADVPFQLPSDKKLNKNNETQDKTNQKRVLPLTNCTVPVDQLLDSSLEDSQIQEILSLIMLSSISAETTSGSQMRSCSKSELQRSSDNLHNKVLSESSVAIVGESHITNSTKRWYNQNESKDYSSNVKRKKRFSVASGIVYEDEVSSREALKSSTTTQTLLASNHSEEARGVPSSSSRRGITNPGTSSSLRCLLYPPVLLKLPPGATLVGDRPIFATKDMEKPFACGFSGKNYKKKETVLSHVIELHDENLRFSCEFCGKRFGDQYHLSRHLTTHSPDKPFSCHVCGMRFRLKSDLCHHRCALAEERPFSCNICNKSFKTREGFISHSKVHKEEELSKSVICNICKKVFTLPSRLNQLLMIHSDDKSFSYYEEEKEVSSSEISQRSTMEQTLLSSDHSESANEVLAPSSRQAYNDRGTASTFCNHIESMLTSKLPPGSTLVGNKGVFRIRDKEKPFACGYCGKVYKEKRDAYAHISYHHGEKRFSCEFCGKGYAFESDFSKHVTMHTQEKPFTCDECGKQFRHEGGLRNHKYTHSEERLFPCNKCSKSFKTGCALSEHKGSHNKDEQREGVICNKEKPFACGYCGKVYKKKKDAYKHIRYQHGEKRFSCEFCGKGYAFESGLSKHVTMHTQEKPFTCDQCGKQFRLEGSLRNHKYIHSEERLFPCNQCNKSFKTSNNLSRHKESHNKDEQRKGVICNICKRKFRKPYILKEHMTIHTGEKPYKCSLCNKQYRVKVELRYHMNTHNGKKRLADKRCTVCGKAIAANYMPTHMRMHTGEKPFECNICKKRFPKKINLEGHMRSHTGEKPFACGGCDKRFALYSNMMTHKAKCTGLSENVA